MKHYLLFILLFFVYQTKAQVVINEVDADSPGTDTKEFIELKTSSPNMPLDGYVVVLYNGSDDQSYEAFDLDSYSSNVNGLFILGTSGVSPPPDYVFNKVDNVIQNGADAVAIYQDNASNFPNDTPIKLSGLIDVLVYDTNDSDDSVLLDGFGVSTQYNEDENGDKDNQSNQRKSDGTFEAKASTPGTLNDGDITISTIKTIYTEGESFDITFTCSEIVSSDLTINYTLANGNFTSSDYNGDLSVTIVNGSSSANTTIILIDDTDDEGNETLLVSIVNLDVSYRATNDHYSVTINDNDNVENYGTPLNPTYGLVTFTAPDYDYQSLNGLAGQTLRDAITALISNTNEVRAQTYGDVWDMLKEADVNPENKDEVWLLYMEQGRAKTDQQGSGSGVGKWNREHIYPQSRGGFTDGTSTSADGKDIYMTTDASQTEHGHSDAHSLRPADSQENSSRSNKDFGDEYDGPIGNAGTWKGDVARSVMYMALRYNALDVVSGNPDNSSVGELGDLDYLIQWHKADRPDDYEMNRNNVIFDWQKNRNPFIDRPELVDYVFGDKIGFIYNKANDIDELSKTLTFSPNPVINKIVFSEVIYGTIQVYSLNGQLLLSGKLESNKFDLSSLKSGLYIYHINTSSQNFKGKVIKK